MIVQMGLPTMAHESLIVLLYLEENEVKEFFSLTMVPVPDDATQLAVWKRNDVKAQRILMDEPSTKNLRRRLHKMMIQLSGQIPLIQLFKIQFLEIL